MELRIGPEDTQRVVRCVVDADHLKQLTRQGTTASVHYVHFTLDPEAVGAFAAGPVTLAITHPNYQHGTALEAETVRELLADLRG